MAYKPKTYEKPKPVDVTGHVVKKVLPSDRRGRPPAGTVAAKARLDKPKKGGYKTREGTGGKKSRDIRIAALKGVRDTSPVNVKGIMKHVAATTPFPLYVDKKTDYNAYVGKAICFVIATSDRGLQDAINILRPELEAIHLHVPHITDVYDWRKDNPEFDKLFKDARLRQGDYLVDRAMEYATQPLEYVKTKYVDNGAFGPVTTTSTEDNVARSRLIVETIMRRAAQLNPRYRDNKDDESGAPNAQLQGLIAALERSAPSDTDDEDIP